jgi:hypothetical protein
VEKQTISIINILSGGGSGWGSLWHEEYTEEDKVEFRALKLKFAAFYRRMTTTKPVFRYINHLETQCKYCYCRWLIVSSYDYDTYVIN